MATLDLGDHAAVVDFCRARAIHLVVIGPEGPLVDGLVDDLRAAGIVAFGPTRAAARLEGSKAFTKALCKEAGIPTATAVHCTDFADASAALDRFGLPVVIKADGLAAGKGVVVAMTRAQADAAIDTLFVDGAGEALVEEFLGGEEISLFVLTDGTTATVFASAQDHKRIGEGDTGANTGGMGAYSPATVLTPELQQRAMDEIVRPTIAAMAARGTPFTGVLFAGLMLTVRGPMLIEYNVRFGDPETQAMLPRFRGDLAAVMMATATGRLADVDPYDFDPRVAVNVVVAAPGYPGQPRQGDPVGNLDKVIGAQVFVAGLVEDGDHWVTSGGRVLSVTALGADIVDARTRAYSALDQIDYPEGYRRSDIGLREVERHERAGPKLHAQGAKTQ